MKTRYLALPAAALAAVLAFSTCSNPVDLVETATVEVMKANDRYLEVESYAPLATPSKVDPGSSITLTLDRTIDPSTITPEMIQFEYTTASHPTPQETDWEATFNNSSRILTLRPDPYLEDEANYTITISGLIALDGSRMLDPISWAFETGIAPKGSVRIRDVPGLGDYGYTNNTSVRVSVVTSSNADGWCASTTPFSVIDSSLAWVSLATPIDLVLTSPSQGPIMIYAAFRKDAAPSAYGIQTFGTVIYDTLNPVVQPVSAVFTKTATTLSPAITETNPKTYAWTGTGINFGSSASASTTASSVSDGARTARLTVTDNAGNTGYRDISFTWDATNPSVNLGVDRFVKAITTLSATITEPNIQSYAWSVVSGSGVTLSTPTSSTTNASASGDGARTLRLTVTDKCGNTGYDDLVFTWDATAPIVSVGADRYVSASTILNATVTETNVNSYAWSVVSGSGVTLGTPSASTTTASASSDGPRTIRLTVTDKAGSTGYDDLFFTWDSTPPLAPSVSGSTPTFDSTPEWTWSTGGGGGGTTYRYQLDSQTGTWITVTSVFAYTPGSSLAEGNHTLYVQQRDSTYSYYSSSGSRTIRVTSVLPYDGQKNVDRTPLLTWRDMGFLAAYTVQEYDTVSRVWEDIASTGSTEAFQVPVQLPANLDYKWRVKSVAGKITSYLPSSSGAVFTTGS